jgi:hypothetical protein
MTAEEEIVEKFRKMSAVDQQLVLDFVRSIKLPIAPEQRKDSRGMFAHHLTVPITKEMIDEARREMWANFPRDFPEPEADKS